MLTIEVDGLSARTLFVVGKGGTGKTTVAIVLAHHFAAAGMRVLFVGLEQREEELESARRCLPPSVSITTVDGASALSEYSRRRLFSGAIHRRLVQSELYRQFVAAAPGLKELMALGQVCDAERETVRGAHRFDRIVVDAPPTGQILEVLEMPLTTMKSFAGNLVRFEVERMLTGLQDPTRTAVIPVALAEAMPVQETIELLAGVERLGLALGPVFINRVRTCPFGPEVLDVLGPDVEPDLADALRAGRVECCWAQAHARALNRLEHECRLPLVKLPLLSSVDFGLPEIDHLRTVLEAAR